MNSYQKGFYLCLTVIVIACALLRIPSDDGLRHVGLAFGDLRNWGDVYPFSRFEEFRNYNPWYGYDKTLRLAASLLKLLPFPELVSKFILIKTISIIFSALMFYLALKRSELLTVIKDKKTFALGLMIMIFFLCWSFQRAAIARPFVFGTLFLLYTMGGKGLMRGFISSAMLSFLYPYLSWYYILPASLTHFFAGDRRFSIGAVSFLIPFLVLQSGSFWGLQVALFQSEITRSALNLKIGEFGLTISRGFFLLTVVLFAVLFPGFSGKVRRLNYVNLLILIYMIPSLKYIRYFIDIVLPLLFIGYGGEIFDRIYNPFSELLDSWKMTAKSNWNRVKALLEGVFIKTFNIPGFLKHSRKAEDGRLKARRLTALPAKGRSLKPFIIVIYMLLAGMIFQINIKHYRDFISFSQVLEPVTQGSLVLLSFNQQYKALFFRPDLRIIPSCEIGFPAKEIIMEYQEFMNNGIVLPVADKTGAEYFLESGDIYINPGQGRGLELIKESDKAKLWKINVKNGGKRNF